MQVLVIEDGSRLAASLRTGLDVEGVAVGVEAGPRSAASLRTGLEAEGFAVDVAPDGGEALCLARETEYDAILLDIMLPVLNGYKVCETLRAEGNWTPIL